MNNIIVGYRLRSSAGSKNDGTRGFSKDQLKGKQLLSTFWPDALVIFRAKVKTTRESGRNVSESCFPFNLVFREPPSSITLVVFGISNNININGNNSNTGSLSIYLPTEQYAGISGHVTFHVWACLSHPQCTSSLNHGQVTIPGTLEPNYF